MTKSAFEVGKTYTLRYNSGEGREEALHCIVVQVDGNLVRFTRKGLGEFIFNTASSAFIMATPE